MTTFATLFRAITALCKAGVIHRHARSRSLDSVECTTLERVD